MTTVYLIRHAQAEGNLYRRCHGWYNGLITQKGYLQIDALRQRFDGVHVDAVYSSDLFRTMTTAQAVSAPRGLPVHTDPDLREIGAGRWEDCTWGQLLHQEQESMLAFLRCAPSWQVSGSESYPAVQARFQRAVRRIAEAHPDQTVAIFSHGSAIRTGIAYWLGLPVEQIGQLKLGDNTGVAKLTLDRGVMKLCFYNDSCHLGPLAGAPRRGDGSGDTAVADLAAFSLRFRPLTFPADEAFYASAREDGWMASHHTMDQFDGPGFLSVARRNSAYAANSVLVALAGDTPVGVLQMDWQQQADQKVGRVPFFYMAPDYRSKGLGVQLLGQAISAYRALGRQYIRLRCAPENERAKNFYRQHGFYKVGEEPGGIGHLDTMEKYIGYASK